MKMAYVIGIEQMVMIWFFLPFCPALSQASTGFWTGKAVVAEDTLNINLSIESTETDRIARLGIQTGDRLIDVSSALQRPDSIILDVNQIPARVALRINTRSRRLNGTWHQGELEVPLTLMRNGRTSARFRRRPQEPVPPFPYQVQEIRFPNKKEGFSLGATLTLPKGEGPFPAVVLISGSGPHDRDQSVAGHRPFFVLADNLTRKGIAVLRYDDRGTGRSGGSFKSATSLDFAEDARAAVAYLGSRPEIRRDCMGLVGLSEGAIVAPLAAVRTREVAFIVLLAPTGVTGEEIMYVQRERMNRARGFSEYAIANRKALQHQLFEVLRVESDSIRAAERLQDILRNARLPETSIRRQVRYLLSPWLKFLFTYNPTSTLQKLGIPVLALFGEKDLQVPPDVNLPPVQRAMAANPNALVLELRGLNHLFQSSDTGSPDEYRYIEETMAPAVLELITRWIRERARP